MHRLRNRVSAMILVAQRDIERNPVSGDLFWRFMHGLRNRVSAMILVVPPRYRKKPGFWRFILEIYAQAKKPGFCDDLGGVTKDIERNPVSGDLFWRFMHRPRNRVSAMILVVPPRYRKKPGFWRFMHKPSFWRLFFLP